MRGTHRIIVQNKRIRYDFEIKRNITIIRGDSATGKTTLVDMIREHFENGSASAVDLICDKECAVLDGRTWAGQLSMMKDSIVFIDEGNEFVMSDDFAAAIQETDNYYVIVTREGVPSLPYSVEEIYGIRNSGKYGTLKRTYNELYHLYHAEKHHQPGKPEKVVVEDSNSGFQFFQGICERSGGITCVSSQGKSNIFSVVAKQPDEKTLVIADGAAFGSEMEKLMRLIKGYPNIALYLPESFEWLILKSGVVEGGGIEEILRDPGNDIESRNYFSWERYFTAKLIQNTQDSYLKYTKRQLNPVYLQERISGRILAAAEGISLC
ncbi:MAG: translation initiation factor 2 [Lachnospiraceae bacterium]|nr:MULTISPECIES: translation initiation factor 2 [Lachnospiraceae]MCI8790607.1 translation initiation factor 2 [Lachnospiraceae bacterium]